MTEDKSIFNGASQISKYEIEKILNKPETLKELGQYKISGPYAKPIADHNDVKSILDMIPENAGGFIELFEAQKIAKTQKAKIEQMRKELKPTADINKELEKLRFFKDKFGV